MGEADVVGRLRALSEVMRDFGLTRLEVRGIRTEGDDGMGGLVGDLVLERPAPSPLERAMVAQATGSSPAEEDDEDEVATEEQREKELRREWDETWKRVTAASGASLPAFPGVENAERFLAARGRR